MLSRKVFHFISKFSVVINWKNNFNAMFLCQLKIIFAKCRRNMDNTRSLFFRNKFTSENPKGTDIFSRCKIREERFICFSDEFFSKKSVDDFNVSIFFEKSMKSFGSKNQANACLLMFYFDILKFRVDRECEVAGKRPRCCRPDKKKSIGFSIKRKHDRDRRILNIFIVETCFKVGKWRGNCR